MAIVQALFWSLSFALVLSTGLLILPLVLRGKKKAYPAFLPPLALGFGFLLGWARLFEKAWPDFPPSDSTQWIYFGVLPLILVGALQAQFQLPRFLQMGIRLLLSGLGFLLLLTPLRESMGQKAWLVWALVLACFALIQWSLLDHLDAFDANNESSLLIFSGVSAASGALLMLGHSVVLSQQALILAVLLGAVFVLRLIFPVLSRRGIWGFASLVLSLLLASGYFFADLSAWALLPLLAPHTVWLGYLPGLKNKSPVLRLGLSLVCAILLCVTAVGVTFSSQPPDTGGYY